MDFLFDELVFGTTLLTCESTIQSYSDMFLIQYLESADRMSPEKFMNINADELKEKLSKIVKDIVEALKKFVKDIKIKINTEIQKIQLNTKLEELKDMMAKKRSKVMNKHYNYFDIQKYKKYYTDFINRYTSELKKGLNKEFNTVEEYEKWKTEMMNKLSDFTFKLTDEEQWKLTISINSAVKLSEEEVKNRDNNLKMVEECGSDNIKGLEKYYRTLDAGKSYVNYSSNALHIFRLQNTFIGLVCSKLAQAVKTVIRFVTKHTFACITALLVVLIAA